MEKCPIEFDGAKNFKKPTLRHCWQQCRYDLEAIATLASVPFSRVAQLQVQAAGLGLIYPDGTINEKAMIVLNQLAQQEIRRLGK